MNRTLVPIEIKKVLETRSSFFNKISTSAYWRNGSASDSSLELPEGYPFEPGIGHLRGYLSPSSGPQFNGELSTCALEGLFNTRGFHHNCNYSNLFCIKSVSASYVISIFDLNADIGWSVGAMVARGPPKAKVVGSSPISVALFLFAFGAPAGAWCHEFGTGL